MTAGLYFLLNRPPFGESSSHIQLARDGVH